MPRSSSAISTRRPARRGSTLRSRERRVAQVEHARRARCSRRSRTSPRAPSRPAARGSRRCARSRGAPRRGAPSRPRRRARRRARTTSRSSSSIWFRITASGLLISCERPIATSPSVASSSLCRISRRSFGEADGAVLFAVLVAQDGARDRDRDLFAALRTGRWCGRSRRCPCRRSRGSASPPSRASPRRGSGRACRRRRRAPRPRSSRGSSSRRRCSRRRCPCGRSPPRCRWSVRPAARAALW